MGLVIVEASVSISNIRTSQSKFAPSYQAVFRTFFNKLSWGVENGTGLGGVGVDFGTWVSYKFVFRVERDYLRTNPGLWLHHTSLNNEFLNNILSS